MMPLVRMLICWLILSVACADSGGWIQSSLDELRFNETLSYLGVHMSMYPDWYQIAALNKVNPSNKLHEYYSSTNSSYTKLDVGGVCAVLNYVGVDKGILLVGGLESVKFTIQLAALLKGKHCSVTCSVDVSCTYCICEGQQKLAFIRSDDLSTDRSYPNGHCSASSVSSDESPLCQPWSSQQILSQFSVILLNQGRSANIQAVYGAMNHLINSTSGSQTLMLRSNFISASDCQPIDVVPSVLPELYNDRVHILDVYSSSLAYSTRQAISPGTKIASKSRRKLLQIQALRRASSDLKCIPFDYESGMSAQSDFHLYWSDIFYTELLLSFKNVIFGSQPCCTATSKTFALQQIVTIEFSIVNYMLAYLTMTKVLKFDTVIANPYDVVVISASDVAYEEAFSSWFRTKDTIVPLHNSTIHSFIIGIDDSTCEYLSYLGRPYLCFYYPSSFGRTFPTKGAPLRLAIGLSKVVYPSLFLRFGYNVLYSEMDIFWRGDPIGTDLQIAENWNYDIQVSPHVDFWPRFITLPEELNIGFVYVKATQTSRGMFQDMLRYTCTHPHLMGTKVTWDQKLFDHFIRAVVPEGESAPQWPEHFENWKSFISTNETILWRRLPGEKYTHNQKDLVRISPETMAVHISWGKGKPSERIYCASQLGLVPPVPRFDEEYKGVQCFK